MIKFLNRAGMAVLVGVAGLLGYNLTANHMAADIYQQRIAVLSAEYEDLRGMSNEAIRKTAVTELVVKNGALSVSVPMPDGTRKTVSTPFDPSDEIFCDFIQIEGRLWIRRMYTEHIAPNQGLKLHEQFDFIDWDAYPKILGRALYRPLREGRWIVTVTGSGALDISKVDEDAQVELISAPRVQDYEQIRKELRAEIDKIGPGDVIGHLIGSDRKK